ncbi:TonB-dependent receptor plug domain-containing protein [Flavobacteriaceae bacterium Ap0902]|nr:TonB-dependent receptor plug domain-containing protein [Flavobacteriaceae bacterium Ap0902]
MYSCISMGQTFSIGFILTDEYESPLENVSVEINRVNYSWRGHTDKNGFVKVNNISNGIYSCKFSHEDYLDNYKQIHVLDNRTFNITLQRESILLERMVVTAKENKGLVTTSKINQKALQHLQPSSFSDIFELLPGGKAKDPILTGVNSVNIREFSPPDQYMTSALGTQFLLDGSPLNSAADLQISVEDPLTLYNNSSQTIASRNTYNIGIDTRTISTNDIESVEIIRGIPHAGYGDLTSGLIKIKRKSGQTKWQGRIKVDGFSKSYYVAKGFRVNHNWAINASADYLNAIADPRSVTENYSRFTGSVRSTSTFNIRKNQIKWLSTIDYVRSMDDETVDPDSGFDKIDSYENVKQNFHFINNLDYTIKNGFINQLELKTSIRKGYHDLKQTKWVQFSGPRSISIAQEQGVNNGYFPEISYTSYLKTEGRPLDMSYKLSALASISTGSVSHQITSGIDYKYSKNNGRGQLYDILKPPAPNMNTRPRSYKSIPAYQNIALYLGDKIEYKYNEHAFKLYAGGRLSKNMGLKDKYRLKHTLFLEPRFNFQWNVPRIRMNERDFKIDVTVGYGVLYKQPTLYMLYPNLLYLDFQQLNFYHSNPNLRLVNYMTYVEDVTNYNLTAAKNVKKEIRLDLSYDNHDVFFTYFLEDMKSGFRRENHFKTFYYNRYDTSGIDLENLTQTPDIQYLPYTTQYSFLGITSHQNGSRTFKRGIEFGYTSPRFNGLNTRITFNGAWFKTLYENSTPYHQKPNQSIGGISFPYVGIYKNDTGYINTGLNYNCIIDTYLQNLGLNFSLSLQGTLFLDLERVKRIAEPYAYYDKDGNVFEFTPEDKTDAYKQWLVRNVSLTDNIATHYPMDIVANIKATKRVYNDLKASLFVNRLFSYYAPYKFNDITVKRNFWNEPYFGMELTFNF